MFPLGALQLFSGTTSADIAEDGIHTVAGNFETFEASARGGIDGEDYAWGKTFNPGGQHLANT